MTKQVLEKKYYNVQDKETLELFFNHILESDLVAVDTETNGLNMRKDKIVGFSVSGDIGIGFYMPTMIWNKETQTLDECLIEGVGCHTIAKKLLKMLTTKKLIFHNASFDARIIKNFYGVDLLPYLYADTALLVHTVKEEGAFGYGPGPFSLKTIAKMVQEHIGLNIDEAANQEQIELKESIKANGGGTNRDNFEIYKADIDILAKYAAADTDLTLRIYYHFLEQLKAEGLEKFFFEDEVMPLYREVTIPMEDHGIKLDMELMEKVRTEIIADQENYRRAIITELLKLPKVKEWIIDSALKTFPPQARGRWATRMCEVYNIDLPRTKKGSFSFTTNNVEKLPDSNYKNFLLTNDVGYLDETEAVKISMMLWKEVHNGEFLNIQSKMQLAEIAFDYLGEKPLSKTDKGQAQFDDETIQALGDKYEWCRNLRIYNKLLKIKSTYIDRFYDAAEDGRFYPYFKQNGTVSGRYGSDMQQLPGIKEEGTVDDIILKYNNEVRAFFIADEGCVFLDTDYQSLEPRVFASVAGDPGLHEIFHNGWDFYSTIAIKTEKLEGVSPDPNAENFLKKVNKTQRNKAKGYSLGIPYGMGPYALAMSIGVSQKEAEELVNGYLDGFPKLKEWRENSREFFKQNGYIRNKVGRIRHLDRGKAVYDAFGDKIMDWRFRNQLTKEYGKAQVDSWYRDYKNNLNNVLNFQIQSLAASIVNRAALKINRQLKAENIPGQVVAQIHDQLVVNVNQEYAQRACEIVQDAMENFTPLDGVPLIAVPEITNNLRDGH